MIAEILKPIVKGSKAARGSLKAGVRKVQGPYPATLRQDVVSTTAKTKEQAILEGTNKFIDPTGDRRTIRNYDSNSKPTGQAVRTENRQMTRGTDARTERMDIQTIGKGDFTKGATSRAPHHRLGIAQMDPAYDGLSRAEADELTTKIKKKYNTALGNRSGNRYDLPDDVHEVYHNWERKHDTKLKSMQGMSVDERVETVGAYLDTMARAGDEVIFYLMKHKDKGKEMLNRIANTL